MGVLIVMVCMQLQLSPTRWLQLLTMQTGQRSAMHSGKAGLLIQAQHAASIEPSARQACGQQKQQAYGTSSCRMVR